MADTSLRKILMLTHLPRAPGGLTPTELAGLLDDAGHAVNVRTVQRDLLELSGVFPLVSERTGSANRWAWAPDATSLSLPTMTADEALALFLVERYVYELLPPQVAEHLEARFEQARAALNRSDSLKNWTNRVLLLSRTPAMTPPRVSPKVLMDCYSSLQKGLRLQVTYAKDTRGGSKEFDFSPLGMLLDGEVMYLVGMAREHENVISLALHRMQQSMVLSTKARRLSGFRLEDYARESLFDLNRSGAVKLRLKVRGRLARYLVENKLGPDQTMTDLEDGWSEVRVTANDASPLRWWLLSWGDKVEVLGPAPLRREFGKIFKGLAEAYR